MQLSLNNQLATNPVARLGASHGYRIDGDQAQLNAEILCDEARLTGQDWALQLWTDEGVKIAELSLGLLHPNGTGCIVVGGTTSAVPPAGEGPHVVSMILASGFNGALDSIEDCVSYFYPVSFVQPRLRGTVCSGFTNDEITFDIARIENPRDADNVSGTLALELWALDSPYAGGAWTGTPVASLILGTLNGQCEWSNCRFTTHAGPLPATGQLTLMLREWTAAGYITRDYRVLGRPSTRPSEAEAQPEVAVDKPKAPAEEGLKKAEAKPAAAEKAPVKPVAAEKEPAKAVKAEAVKAVGVSVNSASAEALSGVKGISNAVAKAIVASRPYAKLDDVVRAKGMGEKLLAKVRGGLTL